MMPETLEVTVPVTKEAHELGDGLAEFTIAIKDALADGWQTGQDLPVVMTEALSKLVPAVQGAEKLGNEAKGAPVEFSTAFVLSGAKVGRAFAPAHDPESPAAE